MPANDDLDLSRVWHPPAVAAPQDVRMVLVSECAAAVDSDNYGAGPDALFEVTTRDAFERAGLSASSTRDLLAHGIYTTVAVRHPKRGYGISAATVKAHMPTLRAELEQFTHATVYMLMGDVAIAAINQWARATGKPRPIPAGSTYKIRGGEYFFGAVRVFPSYVQAGKAWFVEASKREMVAQDLRAAMEIAGVGA